MRAAVVGSIAVVVFDAVAAFAARAFEFDYGAAIPGSLVIYLVVGFAAARERRASRAGAAAGAVVALAESTVGWAVSWRIGPGALDDVTAAQIALTVVSVVVVGAAAGFCGGLLGTRGAARTG